jgi:hypothetical protein
LNIQREVSGKQLDPWASQYVDSRAYQAKEDVDALVLSALSPGPGRPGPTYWHLGEVVPNSAEMNVGQVASWLFEKVFHRAPRIVNELINKDRPASAIVLARQRLLDALLAGPGGGALFRDNEFPPERLIHATLLRDTGIWKTDENGNWTLSAPQAGAQVDICAVWTEISLLLSAKVAPTFEKVLQALAAPPLGLRHGPASIWVALFLMVHRSNCAVFERGTLVLELTSEHLQRMHKNPRTFELRELSQELGSRNLLRDYGNVLAALGTVSSGDATYLELSRTLYRWFGRLSDFTQQTGRVAKHAVLVRSALRKAQDPIKLLTATLPDAHSQSKSRRPFEDWLSEALTDLGMAQRRLQDTVSAELGQAFDIAGPLTKLRNQLQAECSGAATGLADAKLKSFILRCTDLTLTDEKWLDSVASVLVQRPLDAWTDETIDRFAQAITEIAGHYRRWLRLIMQRKGAPRAAERFVSLTITGAGGQESALLVATTEKSSKLARSVLDFLKQEVGADPLAAAAALAQALQDLNVMQAQPNSTEEHQYGKREAG